MNKKMYVGNMNYDTTEERLNELFGEYGEVVSVNVVTDRYSGKPRGFAFVEMATEEAANAAIKAINGMEVDGRPLKVNIARANKPGGGGGGGRSRDNHH